MDIKLPLQTGLSSLLTRLSTRSDELSLELHQQIEAKVVDTQILQNRVILAIANKSLTAESPQPLDFSPGQNLKLEVVRLIPTPVFVLQPQPSSPENSSPTSAASSSVTQPQILTVVSATPLKTADTAPLRLDKLVEGQALMATVMQWERNKVLLQLNSFLSRPGAIPTPLPEQPLIALDSQQLHFEQATGQQMMSVSVPSSSANNVNSPFSLKAGPTHELPTTTSSDQAPASVTTPAASLTGSALVTLKPGMLINLTALSMEAGKPPLYTIALTTDAVTGLPDSPLKTSTLATVITVKADKISLQLVDKPIAADTNTAVASQSRPLGNVATETLPKPANLSAPSPSSTSGTLLELRLFQAEPTKPAIFSLTSLTSEAMTLPGSGQVAPNRVELMPQQATQVAASTSDHLLPSAKGQTGVAPFERPAVEMTDNTGSASSKSLLMLRPGMQINLRLLENGTSPRFSVTMPEIDAHETIIDAQKRLLPIQQSSPALMGLLAHWTQHPIADHEVADTLHRLASAILQSLPDITRLGDSTQLKQSIEQSGLFLESTLAELLQGQEKGVSRDDLKFKLNTLLDHLQQQLSKAEQQSPASALLDALKDGVKKTESVLARMTLNQLNSLPHDDTLKQNWVMDIPFVDQRQFRQLEIAIERDRGSHHPEKGQSWGVSITLTPPDLGTIHCKITCYDGSVNTRFWSESATTVEKIASHLEHLQRQLESKGLKTGFMDAHQGSPSLNDKPQKQLSRLLNVKA